ncbi:hypothetical protein HN011_005981 [Eciton burchellii]|nr:hypothetical protein HN011_005981 [Eciton burchellii]
MNLSCPICQECIPLDGLFSTSCGHLFHRHCLISWLERSTTCPKCRKQLARNSVHRIYITKEDFFIQGGCQDVDNLLAKKISSLQCNMRKFKFKMISAFIEDVEISEICKDYDKQIEELWKKFSDMPQTNYTIIQNKCIIDKIFKVYLESRIKKIGLKRDFINYATKYLDVLFKFDELKKVNARGA